MRSDRGLQKAGGTERAAYVTVRARHGGLVEFGTRFASPKPYLRPASPKLSEAMAESFVDGSGVREGGGRDGLVAYNPSLW